MRTIVERIAAAEKSVKNRMKGRKKFRCIWGDEWLLIEHYQKEIQKLQKVVGMQREGIEKSVQHLKKNCFRCYYEPLEEILDKANQLLEG